MSTDETVECPKCLGKGEVPVPTGIGSPRTTQFIICPMCKGTREIPNKRK